jgi:DNA ligase-1
MKLPTLYSRTATGAIQTWRIEVIQDKYRTIFGQKDGILQTTNWTVCSPTNEGRANARNAEEQALFEAQALWKKKKDSGSFENIEQIDQQVFVEPMLAKKYEDYPLTFPVYSSAKLDGFRLVCTKNGMHSRNGKEYKSVPHIAEALQSFFESNSDVILDGELYCDKFANDFNAISSLVRKTKPTEQDLEQSKQSIEYHIYDCVDTSKDFEQRYKIIKDCVEQTNNNSIKLVQSIKVNTQQELDVLYGQYLEYGYEGQMIRYNKQYETKRSKYLLKRKEFQDEEYKILDIIEGDGNKSSMAGAMVFKNELGISFNSNIKGNREFLKELWSNKQQFIGRLATVKFFNKTPGNQLPRFPYVIKIRESFDV